MNVYDFDNTLYRGESGVQMFFFYLRKRPGLIRYAPQVIRAVIEYKRGKVDFNEAITRVGAILKPFLEGIEDYNADAVAFWDKHERRLYPFYKPLQQPDDLIISASPEQSLKEICGRIGVRNYIGTVINEETSTMEFACFRQNKVKAFQERYPGQGIDDFYTDSINDKPLMDLAKRVFLADKGKITQIK